MANKSSDLIQQAGDTTEVVEVSSNATPYDMVAYSGVAENVIVLNKSGGTLQVDGFPTAPQNIEDGEQIELTKDTGGAWYQQQSAAPDLPVTVNADATDILEWEADEYTNIIGLPQSDFPTNVTANNIVDGLDYDFTFENNRSVDINLVLDASFKKSNGDNIGTVIVPQGERVRYSFIGNEFNTMVALGGGDVVDTVSSRVGEFFHAKSGSTVQGVLAVNPGTVAGGAAAYPVWAAMYPEFVSGSDIVFPADVEGMFLRNLGDEADTEGDFQFYGTAVNGITTSSDTHSHTGTALSGHAINSGREVMSFATADNLNFVTDQASGFSSGTGHAYPYFTGDATLHEEDTAHTHFLSIGNDAHNHSLLNGAPETRPGNRAYQLYTIVDNYNEKALVGSITPTPLANGEASLGADIDLSVANLGIYQDVVSVTVPNTGRYLLAGHVMGTIVLGDDVDIWAGITDGADAFLKQSPVHSATDISGPSQFVETGATTILHYVDATAGDTFKLRATQNTNATQNLIKAGSSLTYQQIATQSVADPGSLPVEDSRVSEVVAANTAVALGLLEVRFVDFGTSTDRQAEIRVSSGTADLTNYEASYLRHDGTGNEGTPTTKSLTTAWLPLWEDSTLNIDIASGMEFATFTYNGERHKVKVIVGEGYDRNEIIIERTTQKTIIQDNAATVIDDDTMATATAINVPSAESIKAYVDANAGATKQRMIKTFTGNWAYGGSPTDMPFSNTVLDEGGLTATTNGVTLESGKNYRVTIRGTHFSSTAGSFIEYNITDSAGNASFQARQGRALSSGSFGVIESTAEMIYTGLGADLDIKGVLTANNGGVSANMPGSAALIVEEL